MKIPERYGLCAKRKALVRRKREAHAPDVARPLPTLLDPPGAPSIVQLRGLGKELWRDIDAKDHVAQERATWS